MAVATTLTFSDIGKKATHSTLQPPIFKKNC